MLRRGLANILDKSASDVVFVSALRTPVTRAYKGGFRDTYPEELLAHILKATLAKTGINPTSIEDVTIGTVLSELGGAKAGRMAALHAGLSPTTPFSTVNRQCASGLQSITALAAAISTGQISCGIAGGVESMTRNYGSRAIPVDLSPILKDSPVQDAKDCIMPMGLTSENVAERYGVDRAAQDEFAARSHQKAAAAREAGRFKDEIVPMETRWIADPEKPSEVTTHVVSEDDGIRPTATASSLAKLKPAFKPTGSSTAGNSSQISDGAAATLMMRRSTAAALGLTPIAKFVASAVAGVKPDEMGIGPAVAIPRLLEMTGLSVGDVGVWELNEAFASQALYCMRQLGLAEERVNPNGGAIALGHPLGATGARQMATLLPELERRGERVGVVSMCIGTGSGMASLVVRE
ncbi:3-ketoacyl-CoA thiolase A [Geopyxis carbonaria]|nr:3-ketoacyl-CoA thiolase A [Geopyxis carbonaria]